MKYEFTLTLRPMLYDKKPDEQFKYVHDNLWFLLAPYKASCVAELTQELNVHFHGIIELRDILEKNEFLNRFRHFNKMFGRKTCSQLMYEDTYRKYMKKSIEETKKILLDPIIRDDFAVFQTIFEEPQGLIARSDNSDTGFSCVDFEFEQLDLASERE